MREINAIQVDCPGIVNLFFNINGFDYEREKYYCDSVNQMIDLYDMVTISISHLREKGIFLRGCKDIPDNDNSVYIMANKFFQYTGIDIPHVEIELKKNIPINSGLHGKYSDAVGTLLGLNTLFNTNLTDKDKLFLCSEIDKYAKFFLFGDLSHTTIEGVKVLFNHVFNSYIIAIPKDKIQNDIFEKAKNIERINMDYNPEHLFNSVTDIMPDELKKMREYLSQYPDLNHGSLEMSSNYMVALKDDSDISNLVLDISRQFPRYKLLVRRNANNYKFVRMYK